jgi:outer membrane protein TolC
MNPKIILIFTFFTFWTILVYGQTYDQLVANTISGKDIMQRLPSLSSLQSDAESNSPLLKINDANLAISKLKEKSEKHEWMKNLGFDAGAKYGLFDNLIVSGDMGIGEVATNTTEQTRYNIGIFLKFPLSSIMDKSGVKLAIAEHDKTVLERELALRELRQLVIVQYGNVVKSYRNMVIINNSVEVYRVQLIRAEKDFSNGKITVDEFARLSDMLSRNVINLEDSKVEYFIALKILEETVGKKIDLEN